MRTVALGFEKLEPITWEKSAEGVVLKSQEGPNDGKVYG